MIFENNAQLSTQGSPNNLTQAKHKGALALLGYNSLGEQNAWGKMLAANPVGFGAGVRHRIATGLAGDNTGGDVLKATQDDASAMAWSKAALSFNIAKMAMGGGFGGGAGAGSGTGLTAEAFASQNPGGAKGLMSKIFGDQRMQYELDRLNQRTGLSEKPAGRAISDALSGDIFSSVANSIVGTSNYLKADDYALEDYIKNNTTNSYTNTYK